MFVYDNDYLDIYSQYMTLRNKKKMVPWEEPCFIGGIRTHSSRLMFDDFCFLYRSVIEKRTSVKHFDKLYLQLKYVCEENIK